MIRALVQRLRLVPCRFISVDIEPPRCINPYFATSLRSASRKGSNSRYADFSRRSYGLSPGSNLVFSGAWKIDIQGSIDSRSHSFAASGVRAFNIRRGLRKSSFIIGLRVASASRKRLRASATAGCADRLVGMRMVSGKNPSIYEIIEYSWAAGAGASMGPGTLARPTIPGDSSRILRT